jgi:hypothetical protein
MLRMTYTRRHIGSTKRAFTKRALMASIPLRDKIKSNYERYRNKKNVGMLKYLFQTKNHMK